MLLHICPEPLELGGLAEGADVLLLRVGSLLQDVVEAEVVLRPVFRRGQVHDHGHDLDSPALKGGL